MKVLITGGFGFVGSHLAERFVKNNHKVILVTKSFKKKKNVKNILKKVKIEKIDITNQKKLEDCLEKYKPELIIHLAGETSHSKSFENPLLDVDLNAKSTLIILEKIRKMNLKCRFILGSSFIVVGKPKKLPVNEETSCNPTTIYGANRLLSENYCKIYSKVFNLDAIIFRITNSFGPREQIIPNKNAINYLIYKAFTGDDITIYNKGKFFRDLIFISDVIKCNRKNCEKRKIWRDVLDFIRGENLVL